VVDLRQAIGKGRIMPLTTIEKVILLKRDPEQEEIVLPLEGDQALAILEENGYYNPHLLVHNEFKANRRSRFFRTLFLHSRVIEVNTTGTPEETQRRILEILEEK